MDTPSLYRRPKFLELLIEIRQQMAREADYDVDLFAEMIRSGSISRAAGPVFVEPSRDANRKPTAVPGGAARR